MLVLNIKKRENALANDIQKITIRRTNLTNLPIYIGLQISTTHSRWVVGGGPNDFQSNLSPDWNNSIKKSFVTIIGIISYTTHHRSCQSLSITHHPGIVGYWCVIHEMGPDLVMGHLLLPDIDLHPITWLLTSQFGTKYTQSPNNSRLDKLQTQEDYD